MSRREKLKEQTYQEIIATARQQIAEKGASALSLRGIARRMEMTAPALYRYFEDRDDLVTTLIVTAYQSLQESLKEAWLEVQDQDSAAKLLAVGMAYRDWALAHPEDYALIFGTPIPGYVAPPESTLPLARSSLGVLIQVLEDGWVRGEFDLSSEVPALSAALLEDQPEMAEAAPLVAAALTLWSQVHGLTSLELFGHFTTLLEDPAELYQRQLENQLKLLLKE